MSKVWATYPQFFFVICDNYIYLHATTNVERISPMDFVFFLLCTSKIQRRQEVAKTYELNILVCFHQQLPLFSYSEYIKRMRFFKFSYGYSANLFIT